MGSAIFKSASNEESCCNHSWLDQRLINSIIRNLEIGLCLRRKHILVIGTNRTHVLEYISDVFKVPSSPNNYVHSNTMYYVTEKKVEKLTRDELFADLNNPDYDEVVFYSTNTNVNGIQQLTMDDARLNKIKEKLKLVGYIKRPCI